MKRILLAVAGLSPQVITETLYALHQQGRMPGSICILTTREGKNAINATLLSPQDGQYSRLLTDYDIPPMSIKFGVRNIHVATDRFGTEYDDIADEEENERFLALCMEHAFELTRDSNTEVYFSLAGGRKTMGACLSIAAQCYGRQQDRVFHVLVSPEFESNRDFYYPPPISVPIILKDRKTGTPFTKETRYAEVTLIHLPFFSFRDRLGSSHLKRVETPTELMLSLVREKPGLLLIDLRERKLAWKGREMDMMPARMALYALFAFLKKDSECVTEKCSGCDCCNMTLPSILENDCNIAELYKKILAPYRDHEGMSTTGIRGLTAENFNSYRTRINHDIESAFGSVDARLLQIRSSGKRPGVRYGIALEKEQIRILI